MSSAADNPKATWGASLTRHTWRVVIGTSLVFAILVALRYYGVNKLDREIRNRVEQKLRDHYQGLQVNVRSARRLDDRGIEVRGISIQEAGGAHAPMIAVIEEAIIHCDTSLPELLTAMPKIQRIDVRRVKLRAERKPSGVWNVSHLFPLPSVGGQAPAAVISDGTVEVIDPSQVNTTPLTFRNIELVIGSANAPQNPLPGNVPAEPIPKEKMSLKITGSIAGDHFERVDLEGTWQPFAGSWELRGAVEGLEFSPRLRAALPREAGEMLKPLSSVRGRTYFSFHVANPTNEQRQKQQAAINFVVHGRIDEGRIDDARLPDPLTDVEATIRLDPRGVWIDDLTGRCGPANLKLSAELKGYSLNSPGQIDLTAERLNLDRLTVSQLPAALQKVWQEFTPRGIVDIQTRVVSDGRRWTPTFGVRCHNLSVQYVKFPLRLTDGTGTLQMANDQLKVRLDMVGGGKIINCQADIAHPGADFSGWAEISSQGGPLSIDDRLLQALTPQAELIVRKFQPKGAVSFQAKITRPVGSKDIHRALTVSLHDLTIQHDSFRYPIDRVNGTLQMNDDDWTFHHLTGRNDSGHISAYGTWQKYPADGNQLKLNFTATDLQLEDELRRALPAAMQKLWVNLRPRGNLDHLQVQMKYNADRKDTSIVVDAEKWPANKQTEGGTISIEPTWIRYGLDNVTGNFHYENGQTTLRNLTARHGQLTLQAEGSSQTVEGGGCRVVFNRVSAERIQLDHDLLSALPVGLAASLARLEISGPLNMQGALELIAPAATDQQPQVGWDLSLDMENGRLVAGTPIEHIHGSVQLRGFNGPTGFENRGELNIDSAIVRDVQLTQIRGPLAFDAEQLRFGTWAERELPNRKLRPLTANIFGGVLAIDGQLKFGQQLPFQIQAWLEQGDLSAIARELAPRKQRIGGKVFAVVNLVGTGEGVHTYRGNGQIRLRDADIYELPTIIALLKLTSADRNAFNSSSVDFRIVGDDFELDRIELVGDAITLKGRGRISNAREVAMQLYTQVGRDDAYLPIFRPLLGEASRQFLLFDISGSLDHPVINRQVFPNLNERLQEIFPELANGPEVVRPKDVGTNLRNVTKDVLMPWKRGTP
ncbi:AsmA-like C-terminal region-containing protein [Anatilimnocola floriformis]|uniref:AsmA-like C-terminal region-containing protein n=1 Tax=Anatilimnocola floriformis TaxID=2948575 RepID=UPI0020C525C4|nr:AsmA-like C-terminal region-containing protein [Anatilimnocola floriformis]